MENIRFEGGCSGPSEGRDNTKPKRAEYFPILPDPRKCNTSMTWLASVYICFRLINV